MSEPEGFLSRWTRLKREAGETPEAAAQDEPAGEASPDAPRTAPAVDGGAPAVTAPAKAPGIDLSGLPSIDSITAATDIRGFLAPGVPAELTRAALRRAWVADPKIRDFIGIAENQWDFTDPNGIPGFGPLGPLDDVRRLVARVIGGERDSSEMAAVSAENSPDVIAPGQTVAPGSSDAVETGERVAVPDAAPALPSADDVQCSEETAAVQDAKRSAPSEEPITRAHGGALPK